MRSLVDLTDYAAGLAAGERVARRGLAQLTLDAWAGGRRYLSLAPLSRSPAAAAQ